MTDDTLNLQHELGDFEAEYSLPERVIDEGTAHAVGYGETVGKLVDLLQRYPRKMKLNFFEDTHDETPGLVMQEITFDDGTKYLAMTLFTTYRKY